MIELKPCPFCGNEASIEHIPLRQLFKKTEYYSFVRCKVCSSSSRVELDDEKAAENWNHRVK